MGAVWFNTLLLAGLVLALFFSFYKPIKLKDKVNKFIEKNNFLKIINIAILITAVIILIYQWCNIISYFQNDKTVNNSIDESKWKYIVYFIYALLYLSFFSPEAKLFFIIIISLIPAVLYFYSIHSSIENYDCVHNIDTFLLVIPLILGIVILLLSIFCIQIINEDTNKKITIDSVEFEHYGDIEFCKYCEGRTDYVNPGKIPKIIDGKYLCSNCNSILWYNLTRKSFVLKLSIFMMEQRWQVIAGISALLFFTPMALLVEKRSEVATQMEAEKKENSIALNEILNDLSNLRAQIINLEFTQKGNYDMETFSKLHETYTKTYWNIGPAFERLLENTLNENRDFKNTFVKEKKKRKESNLNTLNEMELVANILNNPKFEISCITLFLEYINCVFLCEKYPGQNNFNKRKEVANRLWHRLRFSSIMIRSLIDEKWILKNEFKYPSSAVDEKFYLKEIFKKESADSVINKIIINDSVRGIKVFN